MGNTQAKSSSGQSGCPQLNQPIFTSMSHQDHCHIVADEMKANVIPVENGRISDLKEIMEYYDDTISLKDISDYGHE